MSLLPTAWPDRLPAGERGNCALTLCPCKREGTFVTYGGQPHCLSCARYIAWGIQPEVPATEAKPSGSPARPAIDAEVEW